MTNKLSLASSSRIALLCALGALVLVSCAKGGADAGANATGNTLADAAPPLDALPLTTATNGPNTPAPLGAALPPAPRVRVARLEQPGDQYAYLDRAYAESRAFANAPPDYAYDYNGERPWVWRANDGAVRVAERLPDGRLRYYYYEPGASDPYLVQDPEGAYAYSSGQLVAMYGPDGSVLPYDDYEARSDQAGRYLAWAAGLYAASIHQQRYGVEQARWQAEQANVAAQRQRWAAEQSQYGAWQAYHDAHDQEEQAHWAGERYRREAETSRFAAATNDQGAAFQAAQAAQQARQIAQRYNPGFDGGAGRTAPAQGFGSRYGDNGPSRGQPLPGPGPAGPGAFADRRGGVQGGQQAAQQQAAIAAQQAQSQAQGAAAARQTEIRAAVIQQHQQQMAAQQAQSQARSQAQAAAGARQTEIRAAVIQRHQQQMAAQQAQSQAQAAAGARQTEIRAAILQQHQQQVAAQQSQAHDAAAARQTEIRAAVIQQHQQQVAAQQAGAQAASAARQTEIRAAVIQKHQQQVAAQQVHAAPAAQHAPPEANKPQHHGDDHGPPPGHN